MDEDPYQSPQAYNAPNRSTEVDSFDVGSKKLLLYIVAFIAFLLLGGAAILVLVRYLVPGYPAD